jgi:hypothetical protein
MFNFILGEIMKLKVLLIAFVLFSFTAFAKEISVPAPVKTAFAKLYPTIKKVAWDKEGTNYEASFKDKVDMSLLFASDGKLLETETTIPISQLPEGVTSYIKEHYKKAVIKDAAKIVKSSGETVFEAEVKINNKSKDLMFDSNGKFIPKTKK